MENDSKIIPWEKVPFSNKFMFYKVMTDNPDLCRRLLETLLHVEIDHIERPSGEYTVAPALNAHGIRLDVYVRGTDSVYDIEIQVADTKNLPERTRYYQGIMDETELNAGTDYSSLKTNYIMFLCLFDLFGKGLPVYTFQNRCNEDTDLLLNDRTYKMFYNITGWEQVLDEEERALFQFILDGQARSEFTEALSSHVHKAQLSPQARQAYMTWEQELKEEAQRRAEKIAPAIAEGMAKDMAKDMVKDMAKDMAQDMAKNLAKDMAKDIAKDMVKDIAKDMAKDMANDMAKDMANDIAKDMAKETAKETARKMLSYGDSIEKIADITQLSVKEIQALQNA